MTANTAKLFVTLGTALSLVLNPLAFAATTAAAPGEPERPRFNMPKPPKRGHVLYGHASPEGRPVHFAGERDSGGRERVFSHIADAKDGLPIFRNGTLETNGKITWDGAFHSRGPGQNVYPNYPAAADAVESIPKNRSLVPSGPVRSVPRGSGRSEVNSPGREYLPEFDEANRPSKLRQTLDWSREKSADLKRGIEGVINGTDKIVDFKKVRGQVGEGMDALKTPTVNFSQAAFAFYTALGFVAAYQLMSDHANNPVAWDQYFHTLTDPVGWVALAGFMAGAAWFYKRLGSHGQNGGVLRQIPYFAGALIAGTLISTSVSVMASNTDVQACLGFTAYKKTGSFKRDYAACDRAYVWFTTSPEEQGMILEIANAFVPVAVTVMAAGGMYLGALRGAQFVADKVRIVSALRSVPVLKGPRAGGIMGTLAIGTAHMILFLGAYEISSSVFGIEKSVREYMTADKKHYNELFGEWARIKKNNWKDPYSWDKVCFDSKRKYQMIYNCDAPDQLDFIGVLNRFGKMQSSWRALQMQETLGAYQQWMTKLNGFQEMMDVSYNFYKSALSQLQAGQLNKDILKAPVTTQNPEILDRDFSHTWQKLYTYKLPEFLLASMACGPELEGFTSSGFWENTRRFMKTYVTGNTSPDQVIDNSSGFKIFFYPPRITSALPGTADTVCEQSTSLIPRIGSEKYQVAQFPAVSQGKTVYGLPQYISENIRPNILSPDAGNNFDQWWSDKVMTGAFALQDEMRKEYGQILDGVYKTAVSRPDYHWCEVAPNRDANLVKYFTRLSKSGDTCGPEATVRLGYGIFNNLKDEMRLYLALTLDLYLSNLARIAGPLPPGPRGEIRFANSVADYENVLIPRALKVLSVFDKFTEQMAVTDTAKRANMEALVDEATTEFNEFSSVVLSGSGTMAGSAYQIKWAQELLDKTKQLFKDSLSYYNILTALDRPQGTP